MREKEKEIDRERKIEIESVKITWHHPSVTVVVDKFEFSFFFVEAPSNSANSHGRK